MWPLWARITWFRQKFTFSNCSAIKNFLVIISNISNLSFTLINFELYMFLVINSKFWEFETFNQDKQLFFLKLPVLHQNSAPLIIVNSWRLGQIWISCKISIKHPEVVEAAPKKFKLRHIEKITSYYLSCYNYSIWTSIFEDISYPVIFLKRIF